MCLWCAQYPSEFVIAADHPFNPHVYLKSTLTAEELDTVMHGGTVVQTGTGGGGGGGGGGGTKKHKSKSSRRRSGANKQAGQLQQQQQHHQHQQHQVVAGTGMLQQHHHHHQHQHQQGQDGGGHLRSGHAQILLQQQLERERERDEQQQQQQQQHMRAPVSEGGTRWDMVPCCFELPRVRGSCFFYSLPRQELDKTRCRLLSVLPLPFPLLLWAVCRCTSSFWHVVAGKMSGTFTIELSAGA